MGDLETCDAKAALDALEQTLEPMPFGGKDWQALHVRVDDARNVADEQSIAIATKLGFHKLGRYAFKSLLPKGRTHYEAWADENEIVMLAMRDPNARGPIERQLSKYHFATWFDDGTFVITWSKTDPIMQRYPGGWHRPGTGNLERDCSSHLVAVQHASEGRRVLRIPDIDTVTMVKGFFEMRCFPRGTRNYMMARRGVWMYPLLLASLMLIQTVVNLIRRRLR